MFFILKKRKRQFYIFQKEQIKNGGFLNFLRPLMTTGLPLMKSVLTHLAKHVLLAFVLSTGMSSADAAIKKKTAALIKNYRSGTTALIISNEEMEDINRS